MMPPTTACGLKEPPMIDDPLKADLLISMLKESLPIEANITQYLAGALMQQSPNVAIPKKCNVTSVFYTGDMGGILCGLDIGGTETENAHVVSITHLAFDRRVRLSREINAYQRHRIKKLKQQQSRGY
jgi:hypothetical protein